VQSFAPAPAFESSGPVFEAAASSHSAARSGYEYSQPAASQQGYKYKTVRRRVFKHRA